MPQHVFEFDSLSTADLIVDAIYRGGTAGNVGDDPLAKLLPCGNQGGFRFLLDRPTGRPKMVVLYTSLGHQDWPDHLELDTGTLTYFGDNRTPGRELHDTQRRGNALLKTVFGWLHGQPSNRLAIPPFFVFSKGALGRDVQFRGLAVPGAESLTSRDDLVAVWRDSGGQRFQNYRATFTIVDEPVVNRGWIIKLQDSGPSAAGGPQRFTEWQLGGRYRPLTAPRVSEIRTKEEQLPRDAQGRGQVDEIRAYFQGRESAFEPCAALLFRMSETGVVDYEVTRAVRDGGRDAIGRYRIGPNSDPIYLDFALEAKCYAESNSVGVRELARLISRLRYRQFGVLVTTSFVDRQAYQEVRTDQHPVVILAAQDIVDIPRSHGIASINETDSWLKSEFPRPQEPGVIL